jgi:hypothetical protein
LSSKLSTKLDLGDRLLEISIAAGKAYDDLGIGGETSQDWAKTVFALREAVQDFETTLTSVADGIRMSHIMSKYD